MSTENAPPAPRSWLLRLRAWIGLALIVVFAGAAVLYVRANWAEFQRLQLASPWAIGVVAAIFLFVAFLRGLLTRTLLHVFNVNLSVAESFGLSITTTLANLVLPFRSGAGLRLVYLKAVYGFPITLFTSMMAAYNLFLLLVCSGLGLLCLAYIGAQGTTIAPGTVITLVAVFVLSVAAICISPPQLESKVPFLRLLIRMADGWRTICHAPGTVAACLCNVTLTMAASATMVYWGFRIFSIELAPQEALLLAVSLNMGGLIGLTPGSMGFQELVALYFATSVGVTPVETLTVMVTMRAVWVLTAALVGTPCAVILRRIATPKQPGPHTGHPATAPEEKEAT